MMVGSPPKPRLRVSSERSCEFGLVSPLLSPSPAAGRRAVWRGGLCAGPPRPRAPGPRCAGSPKRGAGQCPPVPGKESSVGRRSGGTWRLRTPAHPLSPVGFSSTSRPNSVFPSPRVKAGGKVYFCTRARGRAPPAGGWEAPSDPRATGRPSSKRGPECRASPARPFRPHSPSGPSGRSSSGPALPSSPSNATSSSSSSPEAPGPKESAVRWESRSLVVTPPTRAPLDRRSPRPAAPSHPASLTRLEVDGPQHFGHVLHAHGELIHAFIARLWPSCQLHFRHCPDPAARQPLSWKRPPHPQPPPRGGGAPAAPSLPFPLGLLTY